MKWSTELSEDRQANQLKAHLTQNAHLGRVARVVCFASRLRGSFMPGVFLLLALGVVGVACSRSGDEPVGKLTPSPDALRYTEVTAAVPLASGELEATFEEPRLAVSKVVLSTGKSGVEVVLSVSEVEISAIEAVPKVEGSVFQMLDISLDPAAEIDPESLESVRVTFDVPIEWLTEAGGDSENVVLQRLVGDWVPLVTSLIAESAEAFTFEALSPGLSLFAITIIEDAVPTPESSVSVATPSPEPDGSTPTASAPGEVSLVGDQTATPVAETRTPTPTQTVALPAPSPTPTAVRVGVAGSSPTPTRTAVPATMTPVPDPDSPTPEMPSPRPVPTETPTPTPTPTLTPTPTPSPTATATRTATGTGTDSGSGSGSGSGAGTPANTPTPTPTPTLLPGDDRFGVSMHTTDEGEIEYFLKELGVHWYTTPEDAISQVPDGAKALVLLNPTVDPGNWTAARAGSINELPDSVREVIGFHTTAEIQALVAQNPGGAWVIIAEPNRRFYLGVNYMGGAVAAAVYHYYYTTIKNADDTSTVLAPAVLNWTWTCLGACSYRTGKLWFETFVEAYVSLYDVNPPVDALGIQVFPIDWINRPNADPLTPVFDPARGVWSSHAQIAVGEIEMFRQYLDSNGYSEKSIWVTETAVHWGYTGGDQFSIVPEGDYRHDLMAAFITDEIDWLKANSASKKIEHWFYYVSYRQLFVTHSDGFGGISFFNGPDIGASLSCSGQTYRSLSLNEPAVTCNPASEPVP